MRGNRQGDPIGAVLLDMGGVLLDVGSSAGLPSGKLDWRGREVMAQTLRRSGGRVKVDSLETLLFAPWRAEYERRYATGREARWEPHLRNLRRATGSRSRDLTLLTAWFGPYAETILPVAGAKDAIQELARSGYKLALVSNVPLPGRLYLRLLKRYGLAKSLTSFQWSYDVGSRKPSPAMLRAALAELGVSAQQAIMVGDRRSSDVAAGRSAGVRTVWVRSQDDGGPTADLEIASVAELPALLTRI